ncbi:PX domain-containing protein [Heracleum sosnowskyi]|uniref:PX domain-containing protein n=1 Tax=Heracleum sosnowskyi TaxID=360622 RepID=A0AAD8H5N1_9APIA|nr:PX domain-containing protein [Heracleum sosnowskyi]
MSYMFEGSNLSLYGYGFSDPTLYQSLSDPLFSYSSSIPTNTITNTTSPPQQQHRHDGTSPLPLGMDWSPPPLTWNGRDSVWPHDPRTGWSYCVTIPSWTIVPSSSDSNPAAYYRVQVAVQSPDGITTIRGVLRRFNNFLKLFSDLKNEFPKKKLPPAPARSLLRMKNKDYLEERRHALEDWMEKLLSDIDVSRTVHVALFLELEAAARSSFYAANQIDVNENVPADDVIPSDHITNSSNASLPNDDTSRHEHPKEHHAELNSCTLSNHAQTLSTGSVGSDLCSGRDSEISDSRAIKSNSDNILKFPGASKASKSMEADSDLHIPSEILVTLPQEERHAVNKVLVTMQQRLVAANMDREVLLAKLNQEGTVKERLTTKVKDLELELETTKQRGNENLHQVFSDEDKFTQVQWDADDFKRNFTELELKLKSKQDEKMLMEATKVSIIQQNEILQQELDLTREKLDISFKSHGELESKSKSDLKRLIKEVKSLRSCQLELKDEASRLMKEKLEGERDLEQEKQRCKYTNTNYAKLRHQCEVLQNRLKECSATLLIDEEDKLTIDTSSPSNAVDTFTTFDEQIGLLVAEAQLLLQDVEDNKAVDGISIGDAMLRTSDDELRLVLTNISKDNFRLRKLVTLFNVFSAYLTNLLTNTAEEEAV